MSRSSKRLRFRCKEALLCYDGIRLLAFRSSEAAEESIYDGARVKQVFPRAKCCGLIRSDSTMGLHGERNVRPVGRDERFTAVEQDQQEMQSAVPMDGPKNGE
jgi:hypothetical protein